MRQPLTEQSQKNDGSSLSRTQDCFSTRKRKASLKAGSGIHTADSSKCVNSDVKLGKHLSANGRDLDILAAEKDSSRRI